MGREMQENIINNVNNNNLNNNNNNNQDNQNNNNQNFNNNDNSNMNVNMVSMAMMGREMQEGDVYSCVERVLCQASPHNVSDLSSLLLRSTSIMAGLIAGDFTDHIHLDRIFDVLQTDPVDCERRYPCIP